MQAQSCCSQAGVPRADFTKRIKRRGEPLPPENRRVTHLQICLVAPCTRRKQRRLLNVGCRPRREECSQTVRHGSVISARAPVEPGRTRLRKALRSFGRRQRSDETRYSLTLPVLSYSSSWWIGNLVRSGGSPISVAGQFRVVVRTARMTAQRVRSALDACLASRCSA